MQRVWTEDEIKAEGEKWLRLCEIEDSFDNRNREIREERAARVVTDVRLGLADMRG